MTTNVWLEQQWYDYKLRWRPDDYGGVTQLYVPSDEIWLPDIVLYNSADGNFTVKLMTKAVLQFDGLVTWTPPAIYKSLCPIDVEFFPFDRQKCTLKIGSWTYDGYALDIKHKSLRHHHKDLEIIEKGIDLNDYYRSTEWDLLAVPAQKNLKFYPCCSEPYPDIKFNITIRRKGLFYTVNLILPCVAICSVTLLVFYIPANSGEKITMGITILNSLNIFLLLVAEINPPTSIATPLIGKYLLFTMVLVTCSIIVTVFVLNIHFRSPSTHVMSPWIRELFLCVLPRLLLMKRPQAKKDLQPKVTVRTCDGIEIRDSYGEDRYNGRGHSSSRHENYIHNSHIQGDVYGSNGTSQTQNYRPSSLPHNVMQAMIGVNFIADHLKQQDEFGKDEKNQVMTTNVWLEQQWRDHQLKWNPADYGGVERLYVPSAEIWLPDIVLYNSADGNFTVKKRTKATLQYDGLVTWVPPTIYKSLCPINVEFFPYDKQRCTLKIGSWSYDGCAVDIKHKGLKKEQSDLDIIEKGIDLSDYSTSTEWELLEVLAKKYVWYYPCCTEPFPDIKFNITIRRKTLFYTVNLILPCVAICSVTLLVFYIPANSGEKITMGITILNSLNIFLLLVAEINPPTSLATPLIGRYLLFTMVLVTCSIIVTVFVLNVHFRSTSTHTMSPWIKELFLHVLPRLLMIQRPQTKEDLMHKVTVRTCEGIEVRDSFADDRQHVNYIYSSRRPNTLDMYGTGAGSSSNSLPPTVLQAMVGVSFIADHIKQQDAVHRVKQDWQFVAMVLDRLFLWIFAAACIVGTFGIIVQAPTLYDYTTPLERTPRPPCNTSCIPGSRQPPVTLPDTDPNICQYNRIGL